MPEKAEWNFDEFMTFLLIHASHADLEFTPDEQEMIAKNVSPDTFEEIYAQYEEMGEYEVIQTIIDYKGLYYPTNAQKNELLAKIETLFHADGDFSKLEKSLYNFLEKLL